MFAACAEENIVTPIGESTMLGHFAVERDLFLAHFDSKTDVDDIHSIAAVSTMLADTRFRGVRYHAVAGAYGTQGGLYIPANELFDAAFGNHWSDAHADFDRALREVTSEVVQTLNRGGDVWIAEAGQSDFSAALIRNIKANMPGVNTRARIHIVQHSEWNEGATHPNNLNYVKQNADYTKIPDGNAIGNGSPGFRSRNLANWRNHIKKPDLVDTWELALQIANRYNGTPSRYNNEFVAGGGLDFSDVSEVCWIFGFQGLRNVDAFFDEFASE